MSGLVQQKILKYLYGWVGWSPVLQALVESQIIDNNLFHLVADVTCEDISAKATSSKGEE